MINFLFDICSEESLNPLWNVIGIVVKAIWIGVPLILIILGAIDLAKAVITSKEEESKKAWKTFGRRSIYAVSVFLVVWIVNTILSFAANIVNGDNENGPMKVDSSWTKCWEKIVK